MVPFWAPFALSIVEGFTLSFEGPAPPPPPALLALSTVEGFTLSGVEGLALPALSLEGSFTRLRRGLPAFGRGACGEPVESVERATSRIRIAGTVNEL